jgi:hypothetical protein
MHETKGPNRISAIAFTYITTYAKAASKSAARNQTASVVSTFILLVLDY